MSDLDHHIAIQILKNVHNILGDVVDVSTVLLCSSLQDAYPVFDEELIVTGVATQLLNDLELDLALCHRLAEPFI
jgi:hypothetical protein